MFKWSNCYPIILLKVIPNILQVVSCFVQMQTFLRVKLIILLVTKCLNSFEFMSRWFRLIMLLWRTRVEERHSLMELECIHAA